MFSRNWTLVTAATTALSLAILAGCKTSAPKPGATPAAVPSAPASQTNRSTPPSATLPPDSGDSMAPNILSWSSLSGEYHAKPGELVAPFTFALTNVSPHPVVIYETETTCDCTVARLPSKPWTIPSGGFGKINATIDLTNKTGIVTNQIVVLTSKGNRRLFVKAFAADSK